jgi:bacterioferritin-associated ferredoxin
MKACICRNVSDHTVKQVLTSFFKGIIIHTKRRGDGPDQTQHEHNLDTLHEACSGEGFKCGRCACYMAELATEHNHNVRLNELRENLPAPLVTAERDTAPASPVRNPEKTPALPKITA